MHRQIVRSFIMATFVMLILSYPGGPAYATGYYDHSSGSPEYLYSIEGTGSYFLPGPDGDVFYNLGKWYRHRGDSWSMSDDPEGPWSGIMVESVPRALADLPPDFRTSRPMGMIPYRYVVGTDRPDDHDVYIYYNGRYYEDYERHGYLRRWHPQGKFWYFVAPDFYDGPWDDRHRHRKIRKY